MTRLRRIALWVFVLVAGPCGSFSAEAQQKPPVKKPAPKPAPPPHEYPCHPGVISQCYWWRVPS